MTDLYVSLALVIALVAVVVIGGVVFALLPRGRRWRTRITLKPPGLEIEVDPEDQAEEKR
jgi:hypothetical protein